MLEELPFLHPSVLMLVYLWQVACITTCQHSLCYFQPTSSASIFQASDSMNESTWSARRLLQLFSWKQKTAREGSVYAETESGNKPKGAPLASQSYSFPRLATEPDLV